MSATVACDRRGFTKFCPHCVLLGSEPMLNGSLVPIRRECLDHVMVFHERSLRRILTSYFEYYHRSTRRPGAGRKPNLAKRLFAGVKARTAADILATIDTQALVDDLLKNGSKQLKWQVLTALWERVYGKPKQDVSVSGGIVHAHVRDPFLASLPREALEALARTYDELLATHVQNGAQMARIIK